MSADTRRRSTPRRCNGSRRRQEHCLHYTGCEWGIYRYYNLMIDNSRGDDERAVDTIIAAMARR